MDQNRGNEKKNRSDGTLRPAIHTKELTKCFGSKTAVDHLSLTIPEGELFALLGVNGAGKTTTIRMLCTLSEMTSGSAEVLGHDVSREPDAVKQIVGISTQDTAVAEKLTVEENLKFMAEIYADGANGTAGAAGKKNDTLERVNRLINDFGLEEYRNKQARTLSGGWKRKLSIAMALIGDPEVLFLDEPTLGLDVLARRELWKIIERLKGKKTIILTTHYMEEAEALAERIGIMVSGKLVDLGTLEELEKKTGKKGLEEVFIAAAEREGVYNA